MPESGKVYFRKKQSPRAFSRLEITGFQILPETLVNFLIGTLPLSLIENLLWLRGLEVVLEAGESFGLGMETGN